MAFQAGTIDLYIRIDFIIFNGSGEHCSQRYRCHHVVAKRALLYGFAWVVGAAS